MYSEAYSDDSLRSLLHEANHDHDIHPPAPFMKITPSDKADAMRTSKLAEAILSQEERDQRVQNVRSLLEREGGSPTFVNARDSRGRTPLMHAIASCDADVLPVLLECPNVDLMARDRFGNTALMYAVGHGYDHMIRILMNCLKKRVKGDDRIMLNFIHMENYDGETASGLALKAGHEDSVLALSEFLKEAVRKEERRKNSIAYRLGFGKRSPQSPTRTWSRKSGLLKKPLPKIGLLGRSKSSGDDDDPFTPLSISHRRKTSSLE